MGGESWWVGVKGYERQPDTMNYPTDSNYSGFRQQRICLGTLNLHPVTNPLLSRIGCCVTVAFNSPGTSFPPQHSGGFETNTDFHETPISLSHAMGLSM